MENEELVLSFMEVSNLPIEDAKRRLQEAGYCLELAIQQYYDSQQATEPMTSNSQNIQPVNDDNEFEEEVRAPLPRAFDTLVEEESARNIQLIRVGRQFVSSFRDFKRELDIQEDIARGVIKKKCLEDIYRNPIDITSNFDFNYAKVYGQKVGKWLAVLINDESFDSLSFNRDIFNEPTLKVKKLLRDNFILLRKNSNDEEGLTIMRLYNLLSHTIPVFLLIEPLTGELKKNFGECKKLTLRCVTKELKKYSTSKDKQLIYNSSYEDSDDGAEEISLTYTPSTSSSLLITPKPSTSKSNQTATTKYESDEESFASISTNEEDEEDCANEVCDEPEKENKDIEEVKVLDSDDEILKSDDGPQTAILLKLKDENHKFKYPANRTVGQLINYIFRNYLLPTGIYDNQTKRFSLFSQIHNTCLTNLSNDKSLEEAKIHPSIVLMHNTLDKE